jgi:predicted nucleotidyltransferase component of viral defense system
VKDHLLQVTSARPAVERKNVAREYLQVYLLRLLQELGMSAHVAFVGGTALRLLYAVPRFSEDLDFSAVDPPSSSTELFSTLGRDLTRELERAGYRVTPRAKTTGAVHATLIRFEGILKDIGVASDPRLALSVKLEIDTRPPNGFVITTTLVQRYFPVAIVHYDLPSLFAGKLHALLARPHAKGRDWYDLVWYLTEKRGTAPNLTLLANALRQTHHDPGLARRWRAAVSARAAALDWQAIRNDVAPFLERSSDFDQLTSELIAKVVAGG